MRPHHQLAVDRLSEHFQADPNCLALIIGGSVAHGLDREDSDVDFMVVLKDEAFAEATERRIYHHYSTDFTDYPGGYSDGKLMDMAFLRDVAEKGSDPARYAFQDAVVAFSKNPKIDELVKLIPVFPESERQSRIESFFAQVVALKWFAGEAEKRGDPYLMTRVAADLSLFACRLILTHNRMLYPFHKWLLTYVEMAPDKPADLLEKVNALVTKPSKTAAVELVDCVIGWRDWGVDPNGWVAQFFEDVEWTWRYGKPGIADW
jgi:hypothetical protein